MPAAKGSEGDMMRVAIYCLEWARQAIALAKGRGPDQNSEGDLNQFERHEYYILKADHIYQSCRILLANLPFVFSPFARDAANTFVDRWTGSGPDQVQLCKACRYINDEVWAEMWDQQAACAQCKRGLQRCLSCDDSVCGEHAYYERFGRDLRNAYAHYEEAMADPNHRLRGEPIGYKTVRGIQATGWRRGQMWDREGWWLLGREYRLDGVSDALTDLESEFSAVLTEPSDRWKLRGGSLDLRLDCLGSGFAFSHGAYWSGFLLDGRVLLDCPPQTLPHLFRLGVPTTAIDLVLLSHEHSDHIGGVDLFLLEERRARHDWDARGGRGEGVPRANPLAIAGPPGIYDRLREVIGTSSRLPERDDPRIEWFEQPGGSAFEWAGVQVECVSMDHSPGVDALGFRVRHPDGVVAYSGDTRYGEALLSLAEGADLLITECGGDRARGHLEWDDVRALRNALDPSTRVLVTHYDPLAVPEWARSLDGVELAEDFASYEV